MIKTSGQLERGKQTHPGAIKIKSIEISNYLSGQTSRSQAIRKKVTKDITRIIAKMSIEESIYSPTLKLKLGVKDAAAFAETFPISGQEKIRIVTLEDSIHSNIEVEKEMNFFVTNYPNFGKDSNENVSLYTIEGISEHAYLSGFKRISRGYNNPTSTEIRNILINDLEVPERNLNFIGGDISKSKGVINTQTPLAAIEFFRKNTFNSKGSPYYLYQSLNGRINFVSLTDLVKQKSGRTYFDTRGYTHPPETLEDFIQMRDRILKLNSNFNVSAYEKGRSGAFSSRTYHLDWSNKNYTAHNYDYMKEINPKDDSLEPNRILSKSFKIFDKSNSSSLNEINESALFYVSKNDKAFTDDINYGSSLSKLFHKINAFDNLLNTYNHMIEVVGDTKLNPGKVITLNIPSSIDPSFRKSAGLSDAVDFDSTISGRYLITNVRHEIQDGKYLSKVYLSRDSFSKGLENS